MKTRRMDTPTELRIRLECTMDLTRGKQDGPKFFHEKIQRSKQIVSGTLTSDGVLFVTIFTDKAIKVI